ncbi:epidermal Langerhans cell protein LCP1-like [Chanos chanos]|uniref:Epidermal Langerhans cell protein LCP1-like n=1 Tax=Chanos chanos TaxID=29144 RepID=A0A6J2VBI8_CHACN|nr:TOX high mobility group box family member 4-B-like [Chanos chanos]
MDLNFYSDLSAGTEQPVDSEFLDSQPYNGYDSGNKFPGGSETYLTISGPSHPFLSSEQTFHTPSLGDEEFEIPPISLDPDSALSIEDVEAHFGELAEGSGNVGGHVGTSNLARNAVVGANDPSFASTFVNPSSQGLDHLTLGMMNQPGGGALLGSALGVDLGHAVGSHFSSSSPVTIDVPLNDINHGLLGHSQLTTIDQSELNAQLGLGLGGGTALSRSKSPDQPLSATPSPAESLQDEDMEDFRQTMLVDSPVSLSASPIVVSHIPNVTGSTLAPSTSNSPATVRRVGGKPTIEAMSTAGTAAAALGSKKGKKKKDPNEPQKPVSAYALFFRDTQAAIKGQNPNATFGEVSKIVASMWDSLGEEQKQVYKRKTEAAKKDYLKALAAYRANQLSKPSVEVIDAAPSTPPSAPMPAPAPPVPSVRPVRLAHNPDQNTITNICASNIILDIPQVTTRSRTGSLPPAPVSNPAPAPTVTKIIISKQMLQPTAGAPLSAAGAAGARQPPPLQQMLNTPPPPRLQQMVHSPAPPPLQAKPRGGVGAPVSVTATPPPPLQIKIIPASAQSDMTTPIIVTSATDGSITGSSSALDVAAAAHSAPSGMQSTSVVASPKQEAGTEVELNVAPASAESSAASPNLCVRAGCTNPAVESRDWDKEYCSNECVATHCRDIFMAWCSIKSQNSTTVK